MRKGELSHRAAGRLFRKLLLFRIFLFDLFFLFLSSQDSSDWAFILSFNGCAQNDWTVQKLAKAVPPSSGGQRGLGVEVGQGDGKDIGKRQRMVFVQRVLPWKVRESRKMWLKRKICFFCICKGDFCRIPSRRFSCYPHWGGQES